MLLLVLCVGATVARAQVGTFAGIVDTNYSRDCRADGTIDVTGSTDMSGLLQTCINNARSNNQQIVELPCTPSNGAILLAHTLDLTNRPGLRLRGCAQTLFNSTGTDFGTKITCNLTGSPAGSACLDTVGSGFIELSNFQLIMFPGATVGILMGRDNAAGGGSGQYCFQELYNLHDLAILATPQPTANGGLGAIGIANIAAENGIYSNIDILTDTAVLFSATNFVPLHSAQSTFGQCVGSTQSMTGVSIYGGIFNSDRNDRPVMLANITGGFELSGVQFVGGNSFIKFENLSGSAVTYRWRVRAQGEGTGGGSGTSAITTSVGISDSSFDMTLASPPPSFALIPTTNGLTFSGVDLHFDSTAPLINNTQTGTLIVGSTIHLTTSLSASNTTVNGSIVFAPGLNSFNVAFGSNSQYEFLGADGATFFGPLNKQAGSFKIDHPLDPDNKYLLHSFVESPDMMNIYNGVAVLDSRGKAVVTLPDYFEALNKDFRYQLTCIGGAAPVYVAQEINDNRFLIAGGKPGLKVSWQVTGIRHDAYANAHRIPVEVEKTVEEHAHSRD
ncbi:MAG TPA: hypothetical protein VKE71_05170 [Candidatus Angelobacter sp.]|nr:hypothetical protein [Candidatus Angelobacter sp.]